MINVSHAVRRLLPIWPIITYSMSHHTGLSLDPTPRRIIGKIVFFQFRIQILTHESIENVTGFSNGSNTRDVVRRISHNRADFDVAATSLQLDTDRLQPRVPTLITHHRSGILATADTVGTSTKGTSSAVWNASVDDTAPTFFFTVETHIRAFPYLYTNLM
jgi:hypothetical protein